MFWWILLPPSLVTGLAISPWFGVTINLVDAAPTNQPEGGAISLHVLVSRPIWWMLVPPSNLKEEQYQRHLSPQRWSLKKICLHRWSAKFLNPQSTPSKKVEDEIYNVSALILKTQQDHLWTFWVFVLIIFLGRIIDIWYGWIFWSFEINVREMSELISFEIARSHFP